jgi:hypothetical protein
MAWPYSPPRRHVFDHFALHKAAKSTLEALLVPLFGQFLHARLCPFGEGKKG